MGLLLWDQSLLKFFENGVSKGVLFPSDGAGGWLTGLAWEGLINVTESPSGAEPTRLWANNTEYAQLLSPEQMEGSLEVYTYPTAFEEMIGYIAPYAGVLLGQQTRQRFCLSYQTRIHSDGGGEDVGYLIHILYNLYAAPMERNRQTVNDSPEAATFSCDWSATPLPVTYLEGYKNVAKITIDSRTAPAPALELLENALYGVDTGPDSTLPLPDAVLGMFDPGP